MINFLHFLDPLVPLGAVVKSLSESRAKFSLSRRPCSENTGGPHRAHFCLANGWVEAEAEKFKAPPDGSGFIFTDIVKMHMLTFGHKLIGFWVEISPCAASSKRSFTVRCPERKRGLSLKVIG